MVLVSKVMRGVQRVLVRGVHVHEHQARGVTRLVGQAQLSVVASERSESFAKVLLG